MFTKLVLLSLLTLCFAAPRLAQDNEEKVWFDDSALPRTAANTEMFVPEGWMIEEPVSGDLNNDSLPDTALALVEQAKENAGGETSDSRERVLMILFKNSKGEFERVATAKNILICTACGGVLGGETSASDIKIQKGVLVINTLTGSRESTETTFRFRYDPKVKKIALIGYDKIERDRATGASTSRSTNFLTGVRITEEFQYNRKSDKDLKKSGIRSKVSKPTQYFEDVNLDVLDND